MATPGRKPKSAASKRLAGNPGKRALSDAEPKPNAKAPNMPKHLDGEAAKAWRWLVRELRAMRLLASSDLALMTIYCDTWGQYVAIRAQLAKQGVAQFILQSKRTGKDGVERSTFYRNPLVDTESMLKKQLVTCLSEMGLSPVSRARLQVKKGEAADPMAELIARMTERRNQTHPN